MFPPAFQDFASANTPGPPGLAGAVAKIFQKKTPNPTEGNPQAPDQTPDVYANLDPKALLERFQETKKDAQDIRWVFERAWWRVMLYLLDRQWIFFDTKRNEWRDKRLKRWIPKPVTNKLREVLLSIRAMFAAVQLGTLTRPNGDDPQNITTANTVDQLQPLIHEEHRMDERFSLSDFWSISIGNAFFYVWWDPDSGQTDPIFWEQCAQCGQITDPNAPPAPPAAASGPGGAAGGGGGSQAPSPAQANDPEQMPSSVAADPASMPTGGDMMGQRTDQEIAADPFISGALSQAPPPVPGGFMCPRCGSTQSSPVKVGDQPRGKGTTDVVSPFELLLPSYATEFDQVDRLIRIRWRTKQYYEINYPQLAKTLTFSKQSSERTMNMFKALAMQSTMGTLPYASMGVGGAGSGNQAEGITEYEYWERPNKTWPKGLFFRVVGESNEQIVEDPNQSMPGPIPVTTIAGEPLWPWVHQSYEPFGGRLWAFGAIDPLIGKQDQLNQLDSHMQLTMQRMGNPIWLEPKGTEVEKFTGEPGLVVKYTMVGVNGAKPERIPGEPINGSYFTLRQQHMEDIESLAGTYDVLKGGSPSGVRAFSALQLLVERSQSRFTQAFQARGEAYKRWFEIAIELERKYGPTQRTMSVLGPNQTWTYQTFKNSDLQGDVGIEVQDGTDVPKTALGKRAAMETMNNMGFINPNDPDMRHSMMSEVGLSSLIPSLDSAKNAALRQQNQFEQWAGGPGIAQGQPPPLKIQPWDDPNILASELRKWANTDKVQSLLNDPQKGPMINQVLNQFYEQLQFMIQQAQMQQAQMDQMAKAPGRGRSARPPQGDHKAREATQPGHGAGMGQAMGRSNGNSTAPRIVGNGQPMTAA